MPKTQFLEIAKKPANVAFCSISRMQRGPNSGSLPQGRSKRWPCRKPPRREDWPAGDQATFNSGIFASNKSGVAGGPLAAASSTPATQLLLVSSGLATGPPVGVGDGLGQFPAAGASYFSDFVRQSRQVIRWVLGYTTQGSV